MSRIAFVNGRYVPHHEAGVHIEDRGYQFADGVYEVLVVDHGVLVDELPHLDRLDRSLEGLRIAAPMRRRPLRLVLREVLRRNRVRDGLLYLQATRGVARREHKFPAAAKPALVVTARSVRLWSEAAFERGAKVLTQPDIRWGRCDIKSISLLPNILAKQAAAEAGATEAWLIDNDGMVTEGTSSNAWILDAQGRLITRDLGTAILGGVTRRSLLAIAEADGIEVVERPFSAAEAQEAREVFVTSSSLLVLPVVAIDGRPIGNGAPGLTTRRLYDAYARYVHELRDDDMA